MSDELTNLVAELKEDDAMAYVKNALAENTDATSLLDQAKEGMNVVGKRFADGEYFIPELIYSGDILKGIVKILEPYLKAGSDNSPSLGKVVFGTVAGDIHDIGKDLVVFMLEVSGFEVIDLGIDVPVQNFVDAVKESGAKIVGLSGFLTLAFDAMKETIEAINAADVGPVKIMIGGGQIDEFVQKHTGADAFGDTAMDAVNLAKSWA